MQSEQQKQIERMTPEDWAEYVYNSPMYLELLEDNPDLLNEIMKDYINKSGDEEFMNLYFHYRG